MEHLSRKGASLRDSSRLIFAQHWPGFHTASMDSPGFHHFVTAFKSSFHSPTKSKQEFWEFSCKEGWAAVFNRHFNLFKAQPGADSVGPFTLNRSPKSIGTFAPRVAFVSLISGWEASQGNIGGNSSHNLADRRELLAAFMGTFSSSSGGLSSLHSRSRDCVH